MSAVVGFISTSEASAGGSPPDEMFNRLKLSSPPDIRFFKDRNASVFTIAEKEYRHVGESVALAPGSYRVSVPEEYPINQCSMYIDEKITTLDEETIVLMLAVSLCNTIHYYLTAANEPRPTPQQLAFKLVRGLKSDKCVELKRALCIKAAEVNGYSPINSTGSEFQRNEDIRFVPIPASEISLESQNEIMEFLKTRLEDIKLLRIPEMRKNNVALEAKKDGKTYRFMFSSQPETVTLTFFCNLYELRELAGEARYVFRGASFVTRSTRRLHLENVDIKKCCPSPSGSGLCTSLVSLSFSRALLKKGAGYWSPEYIELFLASSDPLAAFNCYRKAAALFGYTKFKWKITGSTEKTPDVTEWNQKNYVFNEAGLAEELQQDQMLIEEGKRNKQYYHFSRIYYIWFVKPVAQTQNPRKRLEPTPTPPGSALSSIQDSFGRLDIGD